MQTSETSYLGPFEIDAAGLLRPATPGCVPRFTVIWRNRPVQIALKGDDGDAGALEFVARLGRVPSTAGLSAAGDRQAALQTITAMSRLLPKGAQMLLAADHSVALTASVSLALPAGVVSLIAAVTRFLLSLQPYLDVLDEGAVCFGTGTVNT